MSAVLNGFFNQSVNARPWFFVDRLQRQLERDFSAARGAVANGEATQEQIDWTPNVDVRETKDAFVLTADLPGVNPQDIEVTTKSGELVVRGSRAAEAESEAYFRIERVSGRFERRFKLPESANVDAVSAKSSHGVLTLTIPKRVEAQARRVKIQAA
ncbi:MAG TPA: Hsp20/alpha crystallin family protein [Steroidobacteraceae bacterium]|nr:Hsp20/alpha crystallin family protein [Steroidobacteraceae bacterium]